jgi:hypothetical protein
LMSYNMLLKLCETTEVKQYKLTINDLSYYPVIIFILLMNLGTPDKSYILEFSKSSLDLAHNKHFLSSVLESGALGRVGN